MSAPKTICNLLFFCLATSTCLYGINLFEIQDLTIKTDRLLLRPLCTTDRDDIFAFTSDPEVAKYSRMFSVHSSHEDTEKYITRLVNLYQKQSGVSWAVVYKPENKVIGIIRMYFYNAESRVTEIGYAFSRAYWGKGLATEAVRALSQFGFCNVELTKIKALVDPRNNASCRVLQKCGFVYESLLVNFCCINNEWCDRIVWILSSPKGNIIQKQDH